MSRLPPELFFDLVSAEEVSAAHNIEVAEYPADEAASLEQFQTRRALAPELFLGAYLPSPSPSSSGQGSIRTLIGYVCATRSMSSTLTHASMSVHDPAGPFVCIHSVCITAQFRHRGIALALVREYIRRVRASGGLYERVLLICHDELKPLYEQAGFECVGTSEVVHGARPWLEMRFVLSQKEPSDHEQITSMGPGVFEALQSSSSLRNRPSGRLFSTFSAIDDIVSDAKANRYDLLCPREGCCSVILRGGVGKLVEKSMIDLEPSGKAPTSLLAPLPPSGQMSHCWLVQPSAMAFENIGFSKSVGQASEGPRLKLLSCADCDLGPLGWCVDGGREFWLVCARVSYRA